MSPSALVMDAFNVLPLVYSFLAGTSSVGSFVFLDLPKQRVATFRLLNVATYAFLIFHSFGTMTLARMPCGHTYQCWACPFSPRIGFLLVGLGYVASTYGLNHTLLSIR